MYFLYNRTPTGSARRGATRYNIVYSILELSGVYGQQIRGLPGSVCRNSEAQMGMNTESQTQDYRCLCVDWMGETASPVATYRLQMYLNSYKLGEPNNFVVHIYLIATSPNL